MHYICRLFFAREVNFVQILLRKKNGFILSLFWGVVFSSSLVISANKFFVVVLWFWRQVLDAGSLLGRQKVGLWCRCLIDVIV